VKIGRQVYPENAFSQPFRIEREYQMSSHDGSVTPRLLLPEQWH
jgi:hypothetical protein